MPSPKFYVQLNPLQINFDICSCLWFNSFALNLYQSLVLGDAKSAIASPNLMYFDVKLEAILPRVSAIVFLVFCFNLLISICKKPLKIY